MPGARGPKPCLPPQAIPGHEARATQALSWAAGGRLFGADLGGDVAEYDLQKLRVKYAVDGFGGPIWSLAADPSGTRLAVSARAACGGAHPRGVPAPPPACPAASRSGLSGAVLPPALQIGCEDGSVKLFQVLPDKIQFERSLDRQKGDGRGLAGDARSGGTVFLPSPTPGTPSLPPRRGLCAQRWGAGPGARL